MYMYTQSIYIRFDVPQQLLKLNLSCFVDRHVWIGNRSEKILVC